MSSLCVKKKKLAVQAPFRHRYRFKSTGIGKNPNDTHPYSMTNPFTNSIMQADAISSSFSRVAAVVASLHAHCPVHLLVAQLPSMICYVNYCHQLLRMEKCDRNCSLRRGWPWTSTLLLFPWINIDRGSIPANKLELNLCENYWRRFRCSLVNSKHNTTHPHATPHLELLQFLSQVRWHIFYPFLFFYFITFVILHASMTFGLCLQPVLRSSELLWSARWAAGASVSCSRTFKLCGEWPWP